MAGPKKPEGSIRCLDAADDALCRQCGVHEFIVPEALPEGAPDLQGFLRPIEKLTVPAGEVIYHEGGDSDWIYTLRQGLAKALQYLPDGQQRIVRLYRGGEAFGMERLLQLPYEHTLVAVNDVEMCRIPVDALRRLGKDSPHLYERLVRHWHDHVRSADTWITQFSTGSVRARVARLILYLAQLESDLEHEQVDLLHGQEIAAVVGVTPESVSRVLADLKRNGVLQNIAHGTLERYQCDLAALNSIGVEG